MFQTTNQPIIWQKSSDCSIPVQPNNVLLVEIEGPVWYTIYHQRNLLLKGFVQTLLFINQPMEKGHLWLQLLHIPYIYIYSIYNPYTTYIYIYNVLTYDVFNSELSRLFHWTVLQGLCSKRLQKQSPRPRLRPHIRGLQVFFRRQSGWGLGRKGMKWYIIVIYIDTGLIAVTASTI